MLPVKYPLIRIRKIPLGNNSFVIQKMLSTDPNCIVEEHLYVKESHLPCPAFYYNNKTYSGYATGVYIYFPEKDKVYDFETAFVSIVKEAGV